MRVISSNREVDAPYETTIIMVDDKNVVLYKDRDYGILLGEYKDNDTAKKVLEDIHKAYQMGHNIHQLPEGVKE